MEDKIFKLVVGELLKVGAKTAYSSAMRNAGVLRLLRRVGLQPERPPADFEGVYAYALVASCWGAPEPVIRFFEDAHLRAAFRQSFETGSMDELEREADHLFTLQLETTDLAHFDYDPRRQIASFIVTFNAMVDATRSPVEARADRRMAEFDARTEEQLRAILAAIGGLESLEAKVDELRDLQLQGVPLLTKTPTGLSETLNDWFEAVGHLIEPGREASSRTFTWVVQVPVRRGKFDRIVVHGVEGEVLAADVNEASVALERARASEAWVVANRRISPAARELSASTDGVTCFTLDELIDQDADFSPYLDWLDEQVRAQGIDGRYVDMSCKREEIDSLGEVGQTSVYGADSGGIESYVDAWLADTSKEHLSVLGEFGTGKTWFALHYAWRLAQDYKAARQSGTTRPRIPLVVPLRDFAKAANIEMLFSEFFFRRHEVLLPNYKAFEQLNRMGRLLLIFDGFDEMAARVDRQSRINNFWELARAVVPNSKVVLTCRTEHFPEAQEGRAVLSAELQASTSALTVSSPQFEVLELLPWSDDQMRAVLLQIADEATADAVMENRQLRDLMRRPVMSNLVLDALPEIKLGQAIDLTRVYLYAVRRKMERDILDERTFTSMTDKLFFLCELSWEMMSTDRMSINYREFPDTLRRYFGAVVNEARDLDHWQHDMQGQTMLIRNSQGDYYPAHKSLLEFFVAYKFAAELGLLSGDFLALLNSDGGTRENAVAWPDLLADKDGDPVTGFTPIPLADLAKSFGLQPLFAPIDGMLAAMMDASAVDRLVAIVRDSVNVVAGAPHHLGANASKVAIQLRTDALKGVNCDGISLRDASFDLGDANRSVDFSHISLRGADCRSVDFENVKLTSADFTDANLEDARYIGITASAVAEIEESRDGAICWLVDGLSNVYKWRPGEGEAPQILYRGQADHQESEVSLDGKYLLMQRVGRATVVDLDAGRGVFSRSGVYGGLFLYAEDDAPREAAFRSLSDNSIMHRFSILDGAARGEIMLPSGATHGLSGRAERASYYLDNRGMCRSLSLIGDEVVIGEAASCGPGVDDDETRLAMEGISREGAWWREVDGAAHRVNFSRFDGSASWSAEVPLVKDQMEWLSANAGMRFARMNNSRTGAVVILHDGLYLWPSLGDTPLRLGAEWAVQCASFVLDGSAVAVSTRFADLLLISAHDGSLLEHHALADQLRSVVFDGATGVPPALLAAVGRQAGSVASALSPVPQA